MNPLVSIVVPAYNAEKYLGEALESIAAQTYRPLQLVFVDDGSTDATASIAAQFQDAHQRDDFQIEILRQPNAKIAAARNTAITRARGDFLAFCDADDFWEPHKIETQLCALENSGKDAITSLLRPFWSPEIPPEQHHAVPAMQPALHGITALLIRREAFERVGPFKESQHAEWIEWMIRARETGLQFIEQHEIVAHRRIHLENNSRKNEVARLEILKAALDRRRALAQNASAQNALAQNSAPTASASANAEESHSQNLGAFSAKVAHTGERVRD